MAHNMLNLRMIVVISFSSSPPFKAEAAFAASAFSFYKTSSIFDHMLES